MDPGIPLARMEEKETAKLLRMEEELKSKVIGQDEAASAIARALRRSRADIKDPRRPIGSFLFPAGHRRRVRAIWPAIGEIAISAPPDATVQVDARRNYAQKTHHVPSHRFSSRLRRP